MNDIEIELVYLNGKYFISFNGFSQKTLLDIPTVRDIVSYLGDLLVEAEKATTLTALKKQRLQTAIDVLTKQRNDLG